MKIKEEKKKKKADAFMQMLQLRLAKQMFP